MKWQTGVGQNLGKDMSMLFPIVNSIDVSFVVFGILFWMDRPFWT